jgi:hypothetical protein
MQPTLCPNKRSEKIFFDLHHSLAFLVQITAPWRNCFANFVVRYEFYASLVNFGYKKALNETLYEER